MILDRPAVALELEGTANPLHLSRSETGRQQPSLPVLLAYGRLIKQPVEVLIDDEQELPTPVSGRMAADRNLTYCLPLTSSVYLILPDFWVIRTFGEDHRNLQNK